MSTINSLLTNGHIAQMTYKWLSFGVLHADQNQDKIYKTIPAGKPIVSGSGGPKERISRFVDSLLPGQSRKTRVLH